jgi:3-hydroxyisobutyrate dehydrogenase-like beta-hydroxyacid dehydrogenase
MSPAPLRCTTPPSAAQPPHPPAHPPGLGPGKGYVDVSTVDAQTSQEIAGLVSRPAGRSGGGRHNQHTFNTHIQTTRSTHTSRTRNTHTQHAHATRPLPQKVRGAGAAFLEAPVSGSKGPAEQGQLIFLCAGDRILFDAAAGPLDVMGKKSFYLGEVGAGANMKLVVNMVMVRARV